MKTVSHDKPQHRTHYRRIQHDEPLWIMMDAGNKDVKAMIHANFGEEIWFPNYLMRFEPDEYKSLQAAYHNRPADYEQSAIFSFDGQGMAVGEIAMTQHNSQQRKGSYKYERGYIGAMFVGAMLHLAPEGHRKINLVVTHPARLPNTEIDALKLSFSDGINPDTGKMKPGKFEIETVDGRKVTYVVRNVVLIEEPIAAFQTYVLNVNGTRHQRREWQLEAGNRFAICDVGGYISHLALGRVARDGRIELTSANLRPIEYGIHHVIESFNIAARNNIPELSKLQSLPLERVTEALRTDGYRLRRNDVRNVEKIVNQAFYPLLAALRDQYEQAPFSNGLGLDGVVLTAGGNALAAEYLTRELFGHEFAVPAEDEIERMRYCAIRGASKGLVSFLAQLDYQRREDA